MPSLFFSRAPRISTLLRCQVNFFLSHVRLVRSLAKRLPFLALGHFFAVRLVAAFNKVEIKVVAKKILSTILLLLQSIIGVRRLAAVERTALPVRLVAAFNKVEQL